MERMPFHYQRLRTQQSQIYYRSIQYQMSNRTTERYRLPILRESRVKEDCRAAIEALTKDRPELFYVSSEYKMVIFHDHVQLEWQRLYSARMTKQLQKEANHRLEELIRPMQDIEDDWGREYALYTTIAANRNYRNTNCQEEHTIIGPLLQGGGVCEGYAKLFASAARLLHLPCILIAGKGRGESHIWNLIQIGARIYHIDVTWDGVYKKVCALDYFNLTDPEIRKDHQFDASIYGKYDSKAGNFYYRNKTRFSDSRTMKKYIYQKMARGENVIRAKLGGPGITANDFCLQNWGFHSYSVIINDVQNTILCVRER